MDDSEALDQLSRRWYSVVGGPGGLSHGDPTATHRPPDAERTTEVDPEEVSTEGEGTATQSPLPAGSSPPLELGPGFALRSTLGRGGMGIVYQVEQESLHREVAYKTPSRESASRTEGLLSEAMVTGYLEHPNIVPVHDLGSDPTGRPYFTMKLVHGIAWADLLEPTRVPDPARQELARKKAAGLGLEDHLRILIAVCQGVAFAHSRHILHRDLKPDNVMIGDYGEVLVVDWGLAVDFSPTAPAVERAPLAAHAGTGGTPAYMAPEMAWGNGSSFGPWTDVYLLGAILHELLTGRPPHRGSTFLEVLVAAHHSRPPDLVGAPAELAGICRRALAPDPAHRHSRVEDLRLELESFLAHRESLLLAERAHAELAVLAKGAAGSLSLEEEYELRSRVIARFEQALELWEGNPGAREGLRRARVEGARRALEREDLGLAGSLLGALPEDDETIALGAAVLEARAAQTRREVVARRTRVALGTTAASLFLSMLVAFFWIRAERDLKEREARRAEQALARESAERRRAALRLGVSLVHEAVHRLARHDWRAARQRLLESWQIHDAERVDASRVRASLFAALHENGIPLATGRTAEGGVHALAFSPDGDHLASADGHAIEVRDAVSTRVVTRRRSEAIALAWSPDGAAIAVAEPAPVLWRWKDGASERALAPADDGLRRLAFTPDGKRLAGAGEAGILRVWDVESGKLVMEGTGGTSAIDVLQISPDGKRAFTGASLFRDVEVRAWDLARGVEIGRREWTLQDFSCGALSPEGDWMYAGGRDQVLRLMDVTSGGEKVAMSGHRGVVSAVALSPGGNRVATGGQDTSVRLWDAASGHPEGRLGWHQAPVVALAFSPDGTLLASGSEDGEIGLWSTSRATIGPLAPSAGCFTREAAIGCVAPDGALVAGASYQGALTLWDLESRRQIASLEHAPGDGSSGSKIPEWRRLVDEARSALHPVTSITFAPDPARLHVAYVGGLLATWDLTARRVIRHRTTSSPVAFSPDGRLALAAFRAGGLQLIDLDTGTSEGSCPSPPGPIAGLALLPGARRALIALRPPGGSTGESVLLVDLADGRTLGRHGAGARSPDHLVVAPDEKTYVTGGMLGGALWEVSSGRRLLDLPRSMVGVVGFREGGGFFRHQDGHCSLTLHAADGEELAVAGEDEGVHGVFARPSAVPGSESVVSFPHLRQLIGEPVLHDLALADGLREMAGPTAAILERLAQGTEVTRDDWARLGRWYLAMGAPGLAARALDRALGHTPLERAPVNPATERLLAMALLRDPRAVPADHTRARALLERELSRLPAAVSAASRAERLRLELLISSLPSR